MGLAIGVVATWTFLKHHGGDEKKEEPKKEEHKEEPRVQHGTNGETFLKLDKEAQEHAGLKVATLEAIELSPEVKGYGRVLDPAPLATLLVEGASARASLDASTKEYERLKTLFAQDQNVSARSLETAEVALKRDQILVEAANTRLALSLGKAVAHQKDLPAFIAAKRK